MAAESDFLAAGVLGADCFGADFLESEEDFFGADFLESNADATGGAVLVIAAALVSVGLLATGFCAALLAAVLRTDFTRDFAGGVAGGVFDADARARGFAVMDGVVNRDAVEAAPQARPCVATSRSVRF